MNRCGFVLIVVAAVLSGYLWVRQGRISRLDSELRAVQAKVATQQAMQQQLALSARQLGSDSGVAEFVEDLYACANRAGIDDIEIMTAQRQDAFTPRQNRPQPGKNRPVELKTSRLQVLLRSDYRSLAEYLHQVDALPRTKRFSRLEMTAEGAAIRMLVMIDLYSLKENGHHVR